MKADFTGSIGRHEAEQLDLPFENSLQLKCTLGDIVIEIKAEKESK